MGRKGADRYLVDQVRGRMTFTETLNAMRDLSAKWPQTSRKLVEDKANGTAVIDVLKREIPGIVPVEPFGGQGSQSPCHDSGGGGRQRLHSISGGGSLGG